MISNVNPEEIIEGDIIAVTYELSGVTIIKKGLVHWIDRVGTTLNYLTKEHGLLFTYEPGMTHFQVVLLSVRQTDVELFNVYEWLTEHGFKEIL